MNTYVNAIAQFIQKNGFTGLNNGLMNGNLGMSIFFYSLSRKTGIINYEKIADDLLDKVFASLSMYSSVDFENGVTGIGWG